MTSLTSLIESGRVTPNERGSSKIAWWAYIHSYDGTIKVKRWWPPIDKYEGTKLDDHAYAKQEKEEGNDNILVLLDRPFAAEANEAQERAQELIRDQLLREGVRVRQDPARTPPLYLEPIPPKETSRFSSIEID